MHTRSRAALEAQRAVMEFLLINHPLDCPICDQGGECELQDLAMGYGRGVSQYQESKRAVVDRDIGPLVQTDMTRWHHCTRCVRFGEEIAGLRELGATGRGEGMEIGTYVAHAMESELSGNIIDLCPVGALTSKPFRYTARTWELREHASVAPHDGVGSGVLLHLREAGHAGGAGTSEEVNEVWLSDRDRFSYEGLYSEDRLREPLLRAADGWRPVTWETALEFAAAAVARGVAGSRRRSCPGWPDLAFLDPGGAAALRPPGCAAWVHRISITACARGLSATAARRPCWVAACGSWRSRTPCCSSARIRARSSRC